MPIEPVQFSVSSKLNAPAEEVWERVITPEGINDEMGPWMKMTMPRGVESLSLESVTLGEPIGRSWILLFGVLPIDYDDVTLVELEDGRRFLERSPMMSMRLWEHERTVDPDGGGCTVTDRIRFQPRLGLLRRPMRPIFNRFFRHRHRRLQRHFGGRPA
jgi:ligand-binding SRPBCC domain-containing protein